MNSSRRALDQAREAAHGRRMRGLKIVIATGLLVWAGAAVAADDQPICADRPSKSTGPCTVPQRTWQVEVGLIDWSQEKSDDLRTDSLVLANTAVKYGISDKADVELWITPLESVHTHGNGEKEHHSSFGDTLLRVKYELTSNNSPVQLALDPFLKIPTANHEFGNGKFEGGLLVPIQAVLGKGPLSLSLGPELDVVANEVGRGHHLATQQVFNLGFAASQKLNLSTEIWAMWDWDPQGTGRQFSWDGSAAYLVSKDLQLDAGANFGLNRETPAVEIYTGVSYRF